MPPTAARLCDRCRVIELDDKVLGATIQVSEAGDEFLKFGESYGAKRLDFEVVDFLPNLPELKSSALSGCELCCFLHTAILRLGNDGEFRHEEPQVKSFLSSKVKCTIALYIAWNLKYERSPPHPGTSLALQAKISEVDGHGIVTVSFMAEAAEGHTQVADWLQIPTFLGIRQWNDPKAAAWSRSAIASCAQQHAHTTEPFKPKRLIDIQNQQIRLVKGNDIDPAPVYAALSYCWGSPAESQAQLRTDSEMIEAKLSLEIQEHMLPNVVKDAISAARSLDIPYLWVDALCIRQDRTDGGDWEEHVNVMGKIYGNARVTIGAISSTSCQEGFLDHQEPELYVHYRSTLRPGATGLLRLRLGYFGPGRAYLPSLNDEAFIINSSLSVWGSRGWTYQEEIMSTRFLGFGKTELLFSCPSSASCLGGYQRIDKFMPQNGLDWRHKSDFITWYYIIRGYNARSLGLTYPTDMFPALAGLARTFGEAAGLLDSDYVAGMWKPWLLDSLLWYTKGKYEATNLDYLLRCVASPQPYITPTWSWLNSNMKSVEPLLLEWGLPTAAAYERLEAIIVPKGQDAFGEITEGRLQVLGKVVWLPVVHLERVKECFPFTSKPWTMDPGGGHRWHLCLDWAPLRTEECKGLMMLLMGSLKTKRPDRTTSDTSLAGLLLHKGQPGTGDGRLFRVGMFYSAPDLDDLDPQPEGSAERFFEGCVDELVEIF